MKELLKQLDCEDEDKIIEAFMNRYDVSAEEAQDIFNETKKWLWLGANCKDLDTHALFIDDSLAIIDEMWHNFILHSKAYYNFCINKLKRMIHHEPTSHTEATKSNNQYNQDPESYEKLVKKQYSLIYDHLGKDTLIKWYDTLANKYTPEYIQSIKKI
ncbi:hypothetical protein LVD17_18760 [Fulvivirga ulvae]|uniref:hypothetical protein n=1 Tax=Fulvivirga ulvae TaxID=2904245 RepID=UPI001F226285|nr:hypothetical protein [Fulvivirga ulvae]UII30336.1 hypothetical protein LVD17_18760 [Fulvivirga ulvae]